MDAILITHHPETGHFLIHRVKNFGTDNPKFFHFHPVFHQYHSALTFAKAMAAMYGNATRDPIDNKES